MRELFSLCSVVLLLGTGLSAIILTETVPSVIQISSNKYIISIDEPTENTSQVKKIATREMVNEQAKSTESSSIVATKIVESQQTGHFQTVTSNDVVKQYTPEPSSLVKPKTQANSQKRPTLNANIPSSEGSNVLKGSNISTTLVNQSTTITSNKSTIQNTGGQALPLSSSTTSSTPLTSTSVSTSNTTTTNMPTLGLVKTNTTSPMIGLANPIKV